MQFVPCIRWSGAKRKQSEEIINEMPRQMKTFWIPFLGGGSVMFQLINSNIKYDRIVASDIYKPLMDIWNYIKNKPDVLLEHYEKMYEQTETREEEFYNEQVALYNSQPDDAKDPLLFHYITRACLRGSIEFDNDGNFITRFQSKVNDNIITPSNLNSVIMRWHDAIQGVEFRCESYEAILPQVEPGDYCFFDPPYMDGNWYHDHNIDYDKFYDFLRALPCDYSITLNGDKDLYPIPDDCYTDHKYIYYGVRKSKSGKPTGSRDSFWMKHTDGYDYDKTMPNARQNIRNAGGSIPQINEVKLMGDIENRLAGIENTLATILNILQESRNPAGEIYRL